MNVRELSVPGCVEIAPAVHADPRGLFLEWFRADVLTGILGRPFAVAQANHSISRRGTLRGVHYALVPPGQAKYVYCPRGAVLDVVVDLRLGSPTYGVSDTARLDDEDRRAVYIPEGVGHAFMALEDDSALTYLCSTTYDPARERAVHPLDPVLNLPWPAEVAAVLSDRDQAAPGLEQAAAEGQLPTWESCISRYAADRGAEGERP